MTYDEAKQECYDLFPYITTPCTFPGFDGMHVYNVDRQPHYNASTGEYEYTTLTGEDYPLEPFVTFRTLEQMQVVNCMTVRKNQMQGYLYNNKFGYRGKLVGVVDDPDPSRNGLYMINNDDRTSMYYADNEGWYALKLKFAED